MKIRVITGPTASGKSALALKEAEQLGGEIVSADSMQLYRGLEIGTAQPTAEERGRVPHHLIGIWDFSVRAEVFTYCRLAEQAIREIRGRGHVPVVVGGTGFYLKALFGGLDDLPADPALRSELDARYDSGAGETELFARMAELDPGALARWKDCRRRLIRALEVKLLSGRSILELQSGRPEKCRYPEVETTILMPEPGELKARISRRCDAMFAAGWLEEARQAIADGLLASPTAHQALGYALIARFFAGEFDFDALRERIKTATWQFARRQRTFFRHQLDFLGRK